MRKLLTLLLPLLIFPPLYILNILTNSGFDLTYPRYNSFYPFPLEACEPGCGTEILGLVGSVIFWIIGYTLYLKLIKKSKHPIESSIAYTIILAVITLITILVIVFYIKLFIPREIMKFNLPSI